MSSVFGNVTESIGFPLSFQKYFFSSVLLDFIKEQKIGQLPQAKPILVALEVNFSNYGEFLKPCATEWHQGH